MRNNKNITMKIKSLVFLMMVFLLALPVLPKFIANATEEGYQGGEKGLIGKTVMEGAGFFLKSQSDFLMLLNKMELEEVSGINFYELRDITDSILVNLEQAQTTYTELLQITEKACYNAEMIANLKNFNYLDFRNHTNAVIFNEVQEYLANGDIRGIYVHLLTVTQNLLAKVNGIQAILANDQLPANATLWAITQIYSETLLFGQYTAEIFYTITGK